MILREIKKNGNISELGIHASIKKICSFPLHMHDAYEIIFVLEGYIDLKCASFTYHLTKGDIFIINVKDLHAVVKGDDSNLLLFIQFDPYIYMGIVPRLDHYFFICDSYSNPDKRNEKLQMIQQILIRLARTIFENPDHIQRIKDIMLDMISCLINNFQSFNLESSGYHNRSVFKSNSSQSDIIYEIGKYLYCNHSQKIDLESLSNYLHLNKYYVSHLTKKATGLSVTDLQSLIRVERSEILLLTTSKSIDQISLECGFSAQRYYEKHFSRWFHAKPFEYREKNSYLTTLPIEEFEYEFGKNIKIEALIKTFEQEKRAAFDAYSKVEYQMDFNATTHEFIPGWKRNVVISNMSDCIYRVSDSLIKMIKKDFSISHIKLIGLFNAYHSSETNRSHFEHSLFQFFNTLIEFDIQPEIVIDLSIIGNHELIQSIQCLIPKLVRQYGFNTVRQWEFTLSSSGNVSPSKKYSNIAKEIKDYFTQSSLFLSLKESNEITSRYFSNSQSLIPYVIHQSLYTKDTMEFYRELYDTSIESTRLENGRIPFNGLFTATGIRNSYYHLWHFLFTLGDAYTFMQNGLFVTKKGNDFYVLLYDLRAIEPPSSNTQDKSLEVTINLCNVNGNYTVTQLEIDPKRSIYKHLSDMNFPSELSHEELENLDSASAPVISFSNVSHLSKKELKIYLQPYGTMLLIFKKTI